MPIIKNLLFAVLKSFVILEGLRLKISKVYLGEISFLNDCRFLWLMKPFQKGSTLKGKNLLVKEQTLS